MTTPHPDASHILFPATAIGDVEANGPRIMTEASGVWITDSEGNRVLDGIAGLWCTNLGHGRPELAAVASEAMNKLDFFHTFNGHSNQAQTQLASRIAELAPGNIDHVFFGCSGSDANDTLVKLARLYHATKGEPERIKVIARDRGYHGTSIATASLTGLASFHKRYSLPEPWVLRTTCPHYWRFKNEGETETEFTQRLIDDLEELIQTEGADTIAAFIGEPMMGVGGVVPPPEGYWDAVAKTCKKHGILLIADEVVSGFGRTGKWFGCEHFDIKPDMVTVAKGITSGVFPLSGALISSEVHDVIRQASNELGGFAHGYTYTGHPVGAAIANKVLDIIEEEGLVENAKTQGEYLHKKLNDKFGNHDRIGEIRGIGLVAGMQLLDPDNPDAVDDPTKRTANAIVKVAYDEGIIVRPLHTTSTLAMSPPLSISAAEIDILVDKLGVAISKAM